jgi:hypothetical protein
MYLVPGNAGQTYILIKNIVVLKEIIDSIYEVILYITKFIA